MTDNQLVAGSNSTVLFTFFCEYEVINPHRKLLIVLCSMLLALYFDLGSADFDNIENKLF